MELSRMRTIITSQVGNEVVYSVSQALDVFRLVGRIKTTRDNKKIDWYDIPIAFDIETSSYYNSNNEKRACMYIWTLSFCGYIIQGRTWKEFVQLTEQIVDFFELHELRRMVIYVHNLAYEFQFFRKYFKWKTVFALEKRKPIYALTEGGIEFRCSYILSGYSLETLANNVRSIKLKKLKGDLDYSLKRNSLTKLSDKELQYCFNDVQIVVGYIYDLFEQGNTLSSLPKQIQDLYVTILDIIASGVKNTEKMKKIIRGIKR